MLHIALLEPEIPPNTGNIARLSAATACPLHLIGPLGFRIDDKTLRRAGLDYWDAVDLHRHASLADFEAIMQAQGGRIFCLSARAKTPYTQIPFARGDALLFGAETRGLPAEVMERHPCFTIPMVAGKVRCLNLGTATGIVLYEGLRQLHAWQNPT
jgi:tRNA (cytidine/uridine-2'-O-)-methyltransferase